MNRNPNICNFGHRYTIAKHNKTMNSDLKKLRQKDASTFKVASNSEKLTTGVNIMLIGVKVER